METQLEGIQLEGKELEEAREMGTRVERDVLNLSERVLTHLYGASHTHDIHSVAVVPNNMKTLVIDGSGRVIGVWQDPPGICRKPRKGEK